MANCQWATASPNTNLVECESQAVTTLKKGNGEIVALCEMHREWMITLMKLVHDLDPDRSGSAAHWLKINDIPV